VGFFSFVGKALKGVGHLVGGVAKIAAPLALGGPLGGLAGGLLGSVLHSKSPMSSTPLKINILGSGRSIPILRAKAGGLQSTPRIAAASPVMPGGSIATSQGIMASGGGVPPSSYGGRATGGGRKRKRRSTASRRTSRARSSQKRKSGSRKLKFGSAAYRKKYLGHR
jgi:hypothetical protein